MKKTINEILKRSGHTKTAIAKKLGIERMTLHNWLTGKTNAVSQTHIRNILNLAGKYDIKKT